MSLKKLIFNQPGNFEEFVDMAEKYSSREVSMIVRASVYEGYVDSLYSEMIPTGKILLTAARKNSKKLIKLKISPKDLMGYKNPTDELKTYTEFFILLMQESQKYSEKLEQRGFEVSLVEDNRIPSSIKRILGNPNAEVVGNEGLRKTFDRYIISNS